MLLEPDASQQNQGTLLKGQVELYGAQQAKLSVRYKLMGSTEKSDSGAP